MEIFQSLTLIKVVAFLTLVIGILVKVIGLPDQIKKNYRRKSTEGQSVAFWVIAWLAYLLWAFYGVLKNDLVIVIGQGLGVLTTGIILYQVFIYRKNKKPIVDNDNVKCKELREGKDYIGVGGGCLILNDKDEILLIKRAGEVRNEAGYWSKPGGGIKFGEKAEEAMVREMKEELGIEVKITGLLPHTDHIIKTPQNFSQAQNFDPLYTGGGKMEHWLALNFVAEIVSGEPKNMEPNKCDEVAWFPLDKLPKKITQTTKEPVENYLVGKWIKI